MTIKTFFLAIGLISITSAPADANDDIPFEPEVKVCEKFNRSQIYNCDATNTIRSGSSKLVSLAVHTRITWNSSERVNFPIYMMWTHQDNTGKTETIKTHEDYENMFFTPSTRTRTVDHAFIGRIWRDEVGLYTIILFSNPADHSTSEIIRHEFEVK